MTPPLCLFIWLFSFFCAAAQTNSSAPEFPTRDWHLTNGTVISGQFLSAGITKAVIQNNGTNRIIPILDLTPSDRVTALAENRFKNEFTITYDKFKQIYFINSVQHSSFHESGLLNLKFEIEASTDHLDRCPSKVSISLESHSTEWLFTKNSNVIALFDGQHVDLGEVKDDSDVISADDLLEQLTMDFDFEDFKKMAFAKKFEMQIGIIPDIEFDSASRAGWCDLVRHFETITNQP